jgi:hypothetical protein
VTSVAVLALPVNRRRNRFGPVTVRSYLPEPSPLPMLIACVAVPFPLDEL